VGVGAGGGGGGGACTCARFAGRLPTALSRRRTPSSSTRPPSCSLPRPPPTCFRRSPPPCRLPSARASSPRGASLARRWMRVARASELLGRACRVACVRGFWEGPHSVMWEGGGGEGGCFRVKPLAGLLQCRTNRAGRRPAACCQMA